MWNDVRLELGKEERTGARAIDPLAGRTSPGGGSGSPFRLTYRYLLVVLTRFFAHHPDPDPRNRALLRRWFWRAAIVGPEVFSGWTQAMRALASNVKHDDEGQSVQSLLKAVATFPLKPPVIGKFRSTAASSRILLCALWALEPRSVLTGEPYSRYLLARSLEGRKTAVDVVFTILKREPDGGRAQAANRCILLGDDLQEDARSRFANPPLDVPAATWTKVLLSHGLDAELSASLGKGLHSEFLQSRNSLLAAIARDFLARMTESQSEDTPPLDTLDLDNGDDETDEEDETDADA